MPHRFTSFKKFLIERPPDAIFLLCLFIITTSLFYSAFYIKSTDDIIDTNNEERIKSLNRHFQKLDYCLVRNVTNPSDENNYTDYYITLKAINPNLFENAAQVTIFYELKGWHDCCFSTNSSMVATFQTSNIKNGTVCALVQAPKAFFAHYDSTNACESENLNESLVIFSGEKCGFANHTKIKLDVAFDIFSGYLSESDKNIIYVHLTWSSYLLLVVIIIIVIYGSFYHNFFPKTTDCDSL